MNTFLPYPDFLHSAKVIDKKRCWKQVVEAKQIISILSHLEECPKDKVPWGEHPAVKMWDYHISALKCYFDSFLWECLHIHGINTKYDYYNLEGTIALPWWFGNGDFHRAMRSRLIEKNREFYLPLFPEDKGFNNGKYLWPDMNTKTFKTI
jgi:hypothetical protein